MTARARAQAIDGAVFDDEALAALPSWLARAAGARSAVIQWRHADGAHELIAFNHYTSTGMALYAWKYAPIDPWVKACLATSRRGEWLALDACVSPAAFEKSRLYREFLLPLRDDTFHAAGAVFDTPWGEGVVNLHRGRNEAPFGPADLDPLAACLPHLDRLLRVRGEAIARRRRESVARDTLDGVALGAIVVHADGRIAQVNLIADRVLRRSDGLCAADGGLFCVDPSSRLRLQAALALATAPDNAMATAIALERAPAQPDAKRREKPLAYLVSVAPMNGEDGRPQALLVFRDPDGGDKSIAGRLRALFRPSRAETAAVDGRRLGRPQSIDPAPIPLSGHS